MSSIEFVAIEVISIKCDPLQTRGNLELFRIMMIIVYFSFANRWIKELSKISWKRINRRFWQNLTFNVFIFDFKCLIFDQNNKRWSIDVFCLLIVSKLSNKASQSLFHFNSICRWYRDYLIIDDWEYLLTISINFESMCFIIAMPKSSKIFETFMYTLRLRLFDLRCVFDRERLATHNALLGWGTWMPPNFGTWRPLVVANMTTEPLATMCFLNL